jgi:hypothetical protein
MLGRPDFDFKNPQYLPFTRARYENLLRIRAAGDGAVEDLREYYRQHVADFIEDWGVTYDPRSIELGRASIVPFLLFPKQREFIEWVVQHWRDQTPGIVEKSRDGGISWLCVAVGCALCVLYDGMRVGYGSRKEMYVDQTDDPKSLFWKARFFMRHLPEEFRGGWREAHDSPYMRMKFPATGSSLTGEGGDEIGRGDRTSVYFVDEAAHLPRPTLVDAALSQTTNCRIDVSSVNGPNNSFAVRRHSGKVDVWVWDWRFDPRKDDAWYAKQCAELDPIVVAQEIDRDYMASVEGVVIPGTWLKASIDAIEKLGLVPTGERSVSFDVADGGADKNAAISAKGIGVDFIEEWSGGKTEGDDIFKHVERIFEICDQLEVKRFRYDADGLGAGVRGDARIINERRVRNGQKRLDVEAYRGSGELSEPDSEDVKGRKNEDFFYNRKSQSWWKVRTRFQKTYRWVVEGVASKPDEIISISSKMPLYMKLIAELGQPQYKANDIGKILIQKKPDGMKSPNLADSLVIHFSGPAHRALKFTPGMLQQIRNSGRGARG